MMYFVAKILQTKSHVVIPMEWVFGFEANWERWVNHGINKKEKFICYYSDEHQALDDKDIPNKEYIPDWEAFLGVSKQFPQHGCYEINILYSTGTSNSQSNFVALFNDYFLISKNHTKMQ